MAKKKKTQTKEQRRESRLQKARQWVLTYQGSHIIRAYRKRFRVDPTCAHNDLEAIGALSPEKLKAMREAEEIRLRQKREKRQREAEEKRAEMFHDSDDTFFFIAGYTSGGAPYGVTWAEMGLEPYELPGEPGD